VFVFPLPENAVITELALWINGVRVVAKVMDSDTAKMKYDSIVRRSIDPALLQDMGNNVFKLSVFPIDPVGSLMCERRIEITYAELLPYDAGARGVHVFYEDRQLVVQASAAGVPFARSGDAEQNHFIHFAIACHQQ